MSDKRKKLIARPIRSPVDYEKMRRETMKRFAKTLAYLAKH